MEPFPAYFQQALLLQGIAVRVDSAAVSIFVDILVELTNIVIVNLTTITTNIETAALSTQCLGSVVPLAMFTHMGHHESYSFSSVNTEILNSTPAG